jgi:hypothetical protein
MRLEQTWAGVGVKYGGMILIGAESFEGAAFRLDNWPRHSLHEINITSIKGGLGLGGGIGMSLVFAFNVNTLWEVNGKEMGDWGIQIALPAAKIGVGKLSVQVLKGLTKGADLLNDVSAKRLQNLRTIASLLYSLVFDVREGVTVKEWKVVVIDVPEAGWGAELSAYMSYGEIDIGGRILSD